MFPRKVHYLKIVTVFFLLVNVGIRSYAKTRLLIDNFEDGNSRNELGCYWYTYDDRTEIFGSTDRITGKIKTPNPANLVDTNRNGIYDAYSYIFPIPDPAMPYQPAPYGVNNSRFCGSFTYDLTVSESRYPYVAMGVSLQDAGTQGDLLEVDIKTVKDLSGYTGVSFWIKATEGIPRVTIGFSYKNGPGRHGETPRTHEISVSTEWEFKVVEFSQFQIPSWVFTDPLYSDAGNGFPDGTIKASENKWDKIKALLFQTMDGALTRAPKGTIWVDDIYLVAVSTEHKKFDTDNDGYNDYVEYAAGTDVNDRRSFPGSDLNRNRITDAAEPVSIREILCSPDPFYPVREVVSIKYSLSRKDKRVKIKAKIFDITGKLIAADIIPEQIISGARGEITWNGRDETGYIVQEGIYIVSLEVIDLETGEKDFKCKTVVLGME